METFTSKNFDKELIFKTITQAGKEIIPHFTLNEHDKEVYFRLFLYFFKDSSFETIHPTYKLSKGLCLIGPRGVGKTILFKVFLNLIKQFAPQDSFKSFSSIELCGQYSLLGFDVLLAHTSKSYKKDSFENVDIKKPLTRLYDDLGSEEQFTSYFGSKINVMEKLLMLRYDQFQISNMKTYITTNLEVDDIEKFYGSRVRSRLREMTNSIYYPGVDRRE